MLRDINEHSDALTLQLLLEDLKDLESQQKGKQAAGEYTDREVAIYYLREDILAAQVSVQDGILALSTRTAVATDQNILASIRDEENIAKTRSSIYSCFKQWGIVCSRHANAA